MRRDGKGAPDPGDRDALAIGYIGRHGWRCPTAERRTRLFLGLFLFVGIEFTEVEITFTDILERFAVILVQTAHHPVIDTIVQQYDFDTFFAENFQVGAVFRGIKIFRDNIIYFVLVLLHPPDVIVQRLVLVRFVGMG